MVKAKRLLILAVFFISTVFGSVSSSLPAGAATTDDINDSIRTYTFYNRLLGDNVCGIKDDVSGDDIAKYNFWNVYGDKFFQVGYVTDPSDGTYQCNRVETVSGFTKAAGNAFGLKTSDPGELLCQFGYKQTVASTAANKTSCADKNIKIGGTDSFHIDNAKDNVKQYVLKNALGGKEPKWTKAMAYWSTLQDFTKGCSAKEVAGGSYGSAKVANIRVLDASGNPTTKGYSYETGKAPFASWYNIDAGKKGYSSDECKAMADALGQPTVDGYIDAYRSLALEIVCSKKYTTDAEVSACVAGMKNKNNINYCAGAFTGDSQLAACYMGQGNQGGLACSKVGNYKGAELAACIKGAQNPNDNQYCPTTYPGPDNLNSNGSTPDGNLKNREACVFGQGSPAEPGIEGGFEFTTPETPATGSDATSCAIPGVGWIVCPVTSFLADIADNAFTFLSDNFLRVDTSTLGVDGPVNEVWSTMRSIANVAFIIAFLFIVFSQLTGQGVSNYGIKKLLPRVIIAAILVNVSFFICQIAVDLSNIIGVSIKQFFDSVGSSIQLPTTIGTESGNWAGITIAVLSGTGILVALGYSVLIPFLLGAVIAFVMVFLILVVRQVLIILLIVLSPIAFVAFLLPNTEQWFTKWRKMFTALLLVFPLIGLLFGAAGLASKVMNAASFSTTQDTSGLIMKIVAAGVIALPLFLLPSLLKKSLDGVGNIGNTLNKWSDKLSGGARKGAANSGIMKALDTRKRTKRAEVGAGIYKGFNPVSRARSRINKGLNKSAVFNKLTGDYGTMRGAAIGKLEDEETKMAEAAVQLQMRSGTSAEDQFEAAIRSGDAVKARAAQNILMKSGGSGVRAVRDRIASVEQDGALSKSMRGVLASNITENHGQVAKSKSNDLMKWATSTESISKDGTHTPAANMGAVERDANTWSGLTARELADQSDAAFAAAMASGGVSAKTMEALKSERMRESLSDAKRAAFSSYKTPEAAPTPSTERAFTREQIRAMGPENVSAAVEKRGGVGSLNDGDVISIINAHGGTPVASQAREEAIKRNLIKEQRPRDERTMPK